MTVALTRRRIRRVHSIIVESELITGDFRRLISRKSMKLPGASPVELRPDAKFAGAHIIDLHADLRID